MGRRGSDAQKDTQRFSFLFGAWSARNMRSTCRELRRREKTAGVGTAGVGSDWIVKQLSGAIDNTMMRMGPALSGLVANVRRRILSDGHAHVHVCMHHSSCYLNHATPIQLHLTCTCGCMHACVL